MRTIKGELIPLKKEDSFMYNIEKEINAVDEVFNAKNAYENVMKCEFGFKKVKKSDGTFKIVRETAEDITRKSLSNVEELNVFFGWLERRTKRKCKGRVDPGDVQYINDKVFDSFYRGQALPSFRYGKSSLGPGRMVAYADAIINRRISDFYKQFGVKTPIKEEDRSKYDPSEIYEEPDGRIYIYKKTAKGKSKQTDDGDVEECQDIKNDLELRIVSSEAAKDIFKIILTTKNPLPTRLEYLQAVLDKIHSKKTVENITPFVDETVFRNRTNEEVINHLKERIKVVGGEIGVVDSDIDEIIVTLENICYANKKNKSSFGAEQFKIIKETTLNSAFCNFKKALAKNIHQYYYRKGEIVLV